MQEAKDSSAIENIVTTHDEIYLSDSRKQLFVSLAAKEVHAYATALRDGFEQVRKSGLLTNQDIKNIQATIEQNNAGFRKLPGTALKNEQTGEIINTPPQHADDIVNLMGDLERFINGEIQSDLDPLVKMAVIHHQLESIHPFYNGNGRTGRIVNILYLVQQGLLDTPILYLSRYINRNKNEYYRLLQMVRNSGYSLAAWEEWVIFMVTGIEETSHQTTILVNEIKRLMQHHKTILREQLPKIYNQDLINNLFRHPYTKIEFVMDDLQIHRATAARHLDAVVQAGILSKHKMGTHNYYLNDALFDLLHNVGTQQNAQDD